MLYALDCYHGDEHIKTFIWELIAPGSNNTVSKKHSGHLVMCPPFYSKNGSANAFSRMGELLLRGHFEAVWPETGESTQFACMLDRKRCSFSVGYSRWRESAVKSSEVMYDEWPLQIARFE